jgi:hypothetical protein
MADVRAAKYVDLQAIVGDSHFLDGHQLYQFRLVRCAIAVAGAIFLILEFYRPFGGFIQISSTSMHNALAQMGH